MSKMRRCPFYLRRSGTALEQNEVRPFDACADDSQGLMMTPSVHEEGSVDLSREASHASRLPSQAASRTASKPTS